MEIMEIFDPLFTNNKGEGLMLGGIYFLKKKILSITFRYPKKTDKMDLLGLDTGEEFVKKTISDEDGIDLVFIPKIEFVGFRFSNFLDYECLESFDEKKLYKFSFPEESEKRFFIRIPILNLKSIDWI